MTKTSTSGCTNIWFIWNHQLNIKNQPEVPDSLVAQKHLEVVLENWDGRVIGLSICMQCQLGAVFLVIIYQQIA